MPLQPCQLVAPKLHAFPRLRLPGIRRWWKLSGGQYLDSRDRESFSSSEKFIFNPTAWVLRYKAKLWNGRLFGNDLACGGRQRGNLLHRLFEFVFASDSSIDWQNCLTLADGSVVGKGMAKTYSRRRAPICGCRETRSLRSASWMKGSGRSGY